MDDDQDLRQQPHGEDDVETSVRLEPVRVRRRWPRRAAFGAIVVVIGAAAAAGYVWRESLWQKPWAIEARAPVILPLEPSDLPPASPEAERLVAKLHDDDDAARWAAAHDLVAIGEPAIGPLIAALGHENLTCRQVAAWCLGEIKDPAAGPPLLQLLASRDEDLRWKAAAALCGLKPPLRAEIERMLDVGGVDCRRCTSWALGQIANPASCRALAAALGDADEAVRWKSAVSLTQIGEPALDCLLAAAHDTQSIEARRCATWAIGEIGGTVAIQALADALRDADHIVRAKAAVGLGTIGGEQAIALLRSAANDESHPLVCKEIAASLKALGNSSQ